MTNKDPETNDLFSIIGEEASEKLVDLKARPYQNELLEKAIQRNIIIYLKTGAGKTYIAVMLIKYMSDQIQGSFKNGAKRTIFLANTVPLVMQQADYIRKNTDLNVGDYYGDKLIDDRILDKWDKAIWDKELETNNILVMSPQILVDMVQHSYIDMCRINLLIFDECHHATGNHPYSQIILNYRESNLTEDDIRILGLTASIVHKKCNVSKFNYNVKKLEDKFGCKVETASIFYSDDCDEASRKIIEKPKIKLIEYSSNDERESQIFKSLSAFRQSLKELEDHFNDYNKQVSLRNKKEESESDPLESFKTEIDNPIRPIKKEISDLECIIEELGIWAFSVALQDSLKKIEKYLASCVGHFPSDSIENLTVTLKLFLPALTRVYISEEEEKNPEKILENSSEKVNALFDYFKENLDVNNEFHAITFVNRKSIAYCLNSIIQNLQNLDEWKFLKGDYVYGNARDTITERMSTHHQKQVLAKFRERKINFLIATNIVEEGVDIPACNIIVRFNKINNFGSYIQSKGRARSKNSYYIILYEENDRLEVQDDLSNFLDIEKSLTEKYSKSQIEEEENEYCTEDDIKMLNQIISPYRKGSSVITCHTAINLINRYCTTLEHDCCSVIYPIYNTETFQDASGNKSFSCLIRLPPNSVLNSTIESNRFQRKKWAKMDAALKMCIELDKLGELSENLTVLAKDEWLKAHYDVEEDDQPNKDKKAKTGSTKSKRKYQQKIADEFIDNHPRVSADLYLYLISIEERPFQSDKPFTKFISQSSRKLGFLCSKSLNEVPSFELYKSNSVFKIEMKLLRTNEQIDEQKSDLLKRIHKSIFVDVNRIKFEINYDDSLYGGFILFLKDEATKFEIDWEYMSSLNCNYDTIYNLLIRDKTFSVEDLKNHVVRIETSENRLLCIEDVKFESNPTSEFPKKEQAKTFKDYFESKYKLQSNDDSQPLIHLKNIDAKDLRNFLKRTVEFRSSKKREESYELLFLSEHVIYLPFKIDECFILFLLPSIFHRINCLSKARKLKTLVEDEISKNLGLTVRYDSPGWNKSLKFHKLKTTDTEIETNDRIDESASSESSSSDEENNPSSSYVIIKNNNLKEVEKAKSIPELIIKENISPLSVNEGVYFPDVYNILQCLTLKTAHDEFDLERYEILGDCFLKLTIVMKIYIDFFRTNEGKMATLKSHRVSNKYLFKLATNRCLQEYIVANDFKPKENWIGFYFDKNKLIDDNRNNLNLSDKSLADCVEALIGVYLINLGTDAAKSFIEWLGFVISNEKGKTDFVKGYELPEPMIAKNDLKFIKKLKEKYENVERYLGYEFKNIGYLYQAFTHPSDINNRHTSSYQKLELVGDAVLDLLITQYIFADKKEHSPGELTDLRQALVNNKFFGHLAVKHNFHKYMSYLSPDIFKKLNAYIEFHEKYPPDQAYLNLENNEVDDDIDENDYDPPKFLADIFESIAGAIYLDSNCSLEAVWKAYYPFFEPYFPIFKTVTPISPVKAFTQLKPNMKIKMKCDKLEEDNTFKASLEVDGETYEGVGQNKTQAKNIAYKKAVKAIAPNNQIIFF